LTKNYYVEFFFGLMINRGFFFVHLIKRKKEKEGSALITFGAPSRKNNSHFINQSLSNSPI